jgi:hypothetical protein
VQKVNLLRKEGLIDEYERVVLPIDTAGRDGGVV